MSSVIHNDGSGIAYTAIPVLDPGESNNTDNDYDETVEKWKRSCHMSHFIYESAYDSFNQLQKILGVLILIITTVNSFLLTAKIIDLPVTILSYVVTFLSGLGQIYGISERTQSYIEYLKELQQFHYLLINRQMLPKEARGSAKEFVLSEKDNYAKLISSAPEVPNWLYHRYANQFSSYAYKDASSARRTGQLLRIAS